MAQSKTNTRIIARNTIKALGLAGGASLILAAPNVTVLLDSYMKRVDKRQARKTLSYLKYRKIVDIKEKNGEYFVRLTKKGYSRYQKIIIEDLKIKTPKRWDKRWRMVLYDIPASRHNQRQLFLEKLRQLGFYKLQDSAWIYPFACEKEVGILTSYLNLDAHVSVIAIHDGNFTDHAISHFKKAGLLM